jgi:putative DNA primase/helicase
MITELTNPAQHVAATLEWLHPGGEVFEICLISPGADKSPHWKGRAFGAKKIVAGWFRDQRKAADLVAQVQAEGIYLTLNPCQPALLARAHERLQANAPRSTDKDMAGLRNLLIDLDPKRPAGVSSSEPEHEAALRFAQEIKGELAQDGWPAPLMGDSGNGAHLVYPIEVDNTPENTELLKQVLGGLGQRWAERLALAGLDLDAKNFNPARLSKLYGTRVGKGDNLPERPHRWARIVELPAERAPVALELLQGLVAAFPPAGSGGSNTNPAPPGQRGGEGRFDLAAYLAHYGVEVVKVKEHGGAHLHCLETCLFDPSHDRNEAAIGQAADGKLFYQCFHNSCKGRGWAEARELVSHGDKLGQFVVGGSTVPATRRRNLRVVGSGQDQGAQAGSPAPQEGAASPATEGFSWSDLGNARRLMAQHGQDLRFNHLSKEWYYWTGSRWSVDNCGEVVLRAKATVESIYAEALESEWESDRRKNLFKFALKSESAGRVAGMLNLVQSEPGMPVLPADFDADPWLFNVANGTINLKTGELRAHRREDMLTCLSPVPYEPEAECPVFEKFLYQIMGDNQGMVDFLWNSLGYALTGDCREQCFWMFWGSGNNGKGTLMDVIKKIFGTYWTNISTETILARDNPGNQIRSDVARLDGPRLVTAAEIDKGRRMSESLVKGLTGQDSITARFLYGKDFDFTPQFKLFVQTNNKPVIRDLTNAMWRRLKLVEFPMDFRAHPDKELPEKLQAELPGILAGLVQGCLTWQNYGGLAEPPEVIEAVQEYRDQMDPLKEFLEAKCVMGPEFTATAGDLYHAYKSWGEDNLKKQEILTKRAFGLTLGEKGYRNGKGTGGVRFWRGLGLRTID